MTKSAPKVQKEKIAMKSTVKVQKFLWGGGGSDMVWKILKAAFFLGSSLAGKD